MLNLEQEQGTGTCSCALTDLREADWVRRWPGERSRWPDQTSVCLTSTSAVRSGIVLREQPQHLKLWDVTLLLADPVLVLFRVSVTEIHALGAGVCTIYNCGFTSLALVHLQIKYSIIYSNSIRLFLLRSTKDDVIYLKKKISYNWKQKETNPVEL